MKTGLVLEGGGLRGAYTAGALSWFKDEGIEFDYSAGISSGAHHLANSIAGDSAYLEKVAVVLASNHLKTGFKTFLKEGQIVGYKHLVDYALKQLAPLNFEKLRAYPKSAEIGVYDLEAGRTVWIPVQELDEDYKYLLAASLIPIAGKKVEIDGRLYADAGAEHMIPIKRSLEMGVDKHLVITTKPQDYVRPETGWPTNFLLAIFYRTYKAFRNLVKNRKSIYYEQKTLINELVKNKQALELYPSKTFDIGRFGGDHTQLKDLFDTGYMDCENRRAEIYAFLEIEKVSKWLLK